MLLSVAPVVISKAKVMLWSVFSLEAMLMSVAWAVATNHMEVYDLYCS